MSDKEFFGGMSILDEEAIKHQRCFLRRVIVGLVLGCFVAACAVYSIRKAAAEPMAQASENGVTITLYNDPCELKDQITNLQNKATWSEGGRVFQGCWAGYQDAGLVVAWFDDKTVALIPVQALRRVTGV